MGSQEPVGWPRKAAAALNPSAQARALLESRPMSMRRARATAPGTMEIERVARPVLAEGEILVRIRACGICGSDLHFYAGAFPLPLVCPGHEASGEVVELGPGVRGLTTGDRVAVEPLLRCGHCWACRVGDYQLCEHFRLLGTTDDGGFADYLRTPAYTAFRLPAALAFDVGALAEPMAVTVHGCRLGSVHMGDRVAILGAGTIGLLTVLAARAAGAAEVIVTARHPHQAAAARSLGADRVVPTDQAGLDELSQFAATHPIDAVIETVGGEARTLGVAMDIVRKGGTIVILGIFTTPPALEPLQLAIKEPRIVGSLTYGRAGARADFDVAIDILQRHAEQARGLITHRFDLEAIGTAFATAADKTQGTIKTTIIPC